MLSCQCTIWDRIEMYCIHHVIKVLSVWSWSAPDRRLIIRGVVFWWECPSIRGTIVPHWKNSQVSAMGVKLHYQQHSNYVISRQVSLNDGENWSTRTSFKLTKLLSRDVYSTSLYDPKSYIGKTTYIWLCWLHLVLTMLFIQ
jgi:hypothetical protein